MSNVDNMKWYGPQVEAKIRRELGNRLERALRMVVNQARRNLSEIGAPIARRTATRGLRLASNTPSAPGEYPHKQTGQLRRNVTHERLDLAGRVGTNVKYGYWLETKNPSNGGRPWLMRTINEVVDSIGRSLGGTIQR